MLPLTILESEVTSDVTATETYLQVCFIHLICRLHRCSLPPSHLSWRQQNLPLLASSREMIKSEQNHLGSHKHIKGEYGTGE
jgi:hypothetical protein